MINHCKNPTGAWVGLACALVASSSSSGAGVPFPELTRYNIVWNSPSQDSLDSMPLSGRLGTGANVWVQDGSIWLYLARNDAYDEAGRLLKLGCIRITPEGGALTNHESFRQELDLASGTIHILAGAQAGEHFQAALWFAGETLIVETASSSAQALEVAYGTWRDQARNGLKLDVWGEEDVKADTITADSAGIRWCHRNADHASSVGQSARYQGIPTEAVHDPADRLVFGGAVSVAGERVQITNALVHWQFWDGRAWVARQDANVRHTVAVALRAGRGADPESWLREATEALKPSSLKSARKDELTRWREFWSRSHVVINPGRSTNDPAWQVGRNYQLFRYMLACNRGGTLPLLFNGGIFTADNPPGRLRGNNNPELTIAPGAPTTPDFRRWLGCRFMSQNQRWIGWPALAAGDADLLAPSLAFYRDRFPVAAARARGLGAAGCVYPEPLDLWGLVSVAPSGKSLCGAKHLTWHFSMMLEHAWMALTAQSVLGRDVRADLAWIEGAVRFFDTHYRAEHTRRTGQELGADGTLVLFPSMGLELAWEATNPIETVAGLRRVTDGLLALPSLVPLPEIRAYLQQVRARLPDLPVGERAGKKSLLTAQAFLEELNKWELPELYAAWPYRLVGVTRPETLALARATWTSIPADRAQLCKQDLSWMPTLVNMAALGWPDDAKQRALDKLSDGKAQVRFPAFFGPGHDWLPDHNWGGSGMVGLQEMLLAAEPFGDGALFLLPAWPSDWDVSFKLHAPQKTTVECTWRGGKIVRLAVTPKSRRHLIRRGNERPAPESNVPTDEKLHETTDPYSPRNPGGPLR